MGDVMSYDQTTADLLSENAALRTAAAKFVLLDEWRVLDTNGHLVTNVEEPDEHTLPWWDANSPRRAPHRLVQLAMSEPTTTDPDVLALRKDAARYRFWRDTACDTPSLIARNLTSCLYTHEIDEMLDKLIDAALAGQPTTEGM
jgi:hypothetical protein